MFDATIAREWAEANQISFVDIEDLIRLYEASLPDWQGLQQALSSGNLKARLFSEGQPKAINQFLMGFRTESMDDLREGFSGLGIEWTEAEQQQIVCVLQGFRFNPVDFGFG